MSTILPYNKGMKDVCPEKTIAEFEEEKRTLRNGRLRARLMLHRSFEDMLEGLASLRGLNAVEREKERSEAIKRAQSPLPA